MQFPYGSASLPESTSTDRLKNGLRQNRSIALDRQTDRLTRYPRWIRLTGNPTEPRGVSDPQPPPNPGGHLHFPGSEPQLGERHGEGDRTATPAMFRGFDLCWATCSVGQLPCLSDALRAHRSRCWKTDIDGELILFWKERSRAHLDLAWPPKKIKKAGKCCGCWRSGWLAAGCFRFNKSASNQWGDGWIMMDCSESNISNGWIVTCWCLNGIAHHPKSPSASLTVTGKNPSAEALRVSVDMVKT